MRLLGVFRINGSSRPVEREVAQVVGAELHLEAVRRDPAGNRHDAGVVDQHVQTAVGCRKGLCEAADRSQVRQIERKHLKAGRGDDAFDLPGGLLPFLRIPHSQHDVRALRRQYLGGLESETAVGPGDHGHFAGQVGDVLLNPEIVLGHSSCPPFVFSA